MKRIVLIMMILCLPLAAGAQKKAKKQANKETAAWRYEIEPVETGTTGTVLIKVWSFSKNPTVAAEQSKKNAVHGVIFKGIPAKDRITGRKPLVTTNENEAFFDNFFADGGDYMRYVALSNSSTEVAKTDKKEYKVGVVVTVSYNELRKYLESQGVMKSLSSGF